MKLRGMMFAAAAALVLGAAAPAIGQPAKTAPSAAPSAQPKDAKKDDAKKDAPKKDEPSGGALPAGHPPIDDGDEQPHAQPARKGGGDPNTFQPPQDIAVDDTALPPGSVVVVVKDAHDKPIAGAPITLVVVHSTVAKGESRERRNAITDASGAARFDGLAFGTGHSYEARTKRGDATYAHPPVALGDKAGKHIVVHAYDATANLDDLTLGMMSALYLSLREDSIQIEEVISVYNLSPMAWSADAMVELPRGFKAFNKQEAGGDARIDEVSGTGAALRGTFPPGRTDIDFRYQVPLDNEATQSLHLRLPPRVAQMRVLAESSKKMTLSVAGFPAAQPTEGRDGKRLLITEKQAQRAGEGIRDVEIVLGGLETPPAGRWVAVVLAVLAAAAGLFYFLQHGEPGLDDDARDDLIEAREALLGEIVVLERAKRAGEIGPKAYARVRASLLEALARIVNMLDAGKRPAAKAPAKRKAAT